MVDAALESVKNAALSIELPFLSEITNFKTAGIGNLTEGAMNQLIEVMRAILLRICCKKNYKLRICCQ